MCEPLRSPIDLLVTGKRRDAESTAMSGKSAKRSSLRLHLVPYPGPGSEARTYDHAHVSRRRHSGHLDVGEAGQCSVSYPSCGRLLSSSRCDEYLALAPSPSPILPFLFLGDEKDARDVLKLRCLGISYVLTVTPHMHTPLTSEPLGFKNKRLPAIDSCRQNLLQYFEDAFEFIGELIDMREELERSEESCNGSVKRQEWPSETEKR